MFERFTRMGPAGSLVAEVFASMHWDSVRGPVYILVAAIPLQFPFVAWASSRG